MSDFNKAKPMYIGRGDKSSPIFARGYNASLMPNDIGDGESARLINCRLEGQYTVPRNGRSGVYTDGSTLLMGNSAHFLGKTYVACQRTSVSSVLLYQVDTGATTTVGSFTASSNKWGMFEGMYRSSPFPIPSSIITTRTGNDGAGSVNLVDTLTTANQTPSQINSQLSTPPTDIRKALYVLDGVSGGALYEDSGSILQGVAMSSIFSACTIGTWFNNRAWYAGRAGFENVLYLSMTNAGNWYGADISSKLADSYTLTFPNPIKGLVKTEYSLFVFMENQIAVIDADDQLNIGGLPVYRSKPITSKEGILHNNFAYAVGNAVYYYSKSGKICRITRGQSADGHFEVQDVSHHPTSGIKGYMNIVENAQNPNPMTMPYFFVYDSRNNLLKFHCQRTDNNPIAGLTENDTVIIYDLSRETWLIDELYTGSIGGCVHGVAVGGEVYLLANQSRKILLDEKGFTDNGDSIYVQRRSKLFDLGDWSMKKEIFQTRTVWQGLSSASITQTIFVHDQVTKSKQVTLTPTDIAQGGGRNLTGLQTSVLYQPRTSLFTPLGSNGGTMISHYNVLEKSNLGLRGYSFEVLWESVISSQANFFRLQSFDATIQSLDQKVSSPSS